YATLSRSGGRLDEQLLRGHREARVVDRAPHGGDVGVDAGERTAEDHGGRVQEVHQGGQGRPELFAGAADGGGRIRLEGLREARDVADRGDVEPLADELPADRGAARDGLEAAGAAAGALPALRAGHRHMGDVSRDPSASVDELAAGDQARADPGAGLDVDEVRDRLVARDELAES